MEKGTHPEEEINIELPPDSQRRPIATLYEGFAVTIENHPNYAARKNPALPGYMTLKQFMRYCRERSDDNYTNERGREAQERIRKYFALLR